MNGRGRFDCLYELPHSVRSIIQGNGTKVNQNIFNNCMIVSYATNDALFNCLPLKYSAFSSKVVPLICCLFIPPMKASRSHKIVRVSFARVTAV